MKIGKTIRYVNIVLVIVTLLNLYCTSQSAENPVELQPQPCELALPEDLEGSVLQPVSEEETAAPAIAASQRGEVSRQGIGREQEDLVYLGEFKVTYYCSGDCCNGIWSGNTATGAVPAAWHTIAVDPKVIPLGSEIEIEGYGKFVAEDVGSAIKGDHIDLLVDSHDQAMELGVASKKIYMIL